MSYESKNKEYIKYLKAKRNEISGKIKKIESELDSLIEEDTLIYKILEDVKAKEEIEITEYEKSTGECVHNWVPDGHDSHYSYDVCTKCKEIIKY